MKPEAPGGGNNLARVDLDLGVLVGASEALDVTEPHLAPRGGKWPPSQIAPEMRQGMDVVDRIP